MYTDIDKEKMRVFIQKLISNPCFEKESIISIEDNIIQFYIQNKKALLATFSSQNYFPELSIKFIEELFQKMLFEEINKDLIPVIKKNINNKINYNFLSQLFKMPIKLEILQDELTSVILKYVNRIEIRRNLNSVLKLLNNNLIYKYINALFESRGYITREITVIEKLKLEPEMIPELIKIIIIISLFGYLRNDINDLSIEQQIKTKPIRAGNTDMQKAFYLKLLKQLFIKSTLAHEEIMNRAVSFHINFEDDKSIPATSRFAKIFFLFGKNYNPKTKLDKGADAYEKSWFQAQKKNYKYFGFDIDMINELYKISVVKYW
jgi:hypothetical protein